MGIDRQTESGCKYLLPIKYWALVTQADKRPCLVNLFYREKQNKPGSNSKLQSINSMMKIKYWDWLGVAWVRVEMEEATLVWLLRNASWRR